jgi:hypothetical protein
VFALYCNTIAAGDGCAIRCSYKADDGFLYPLDKAFFYVHKPPMCINHSDIEYVEFQRQGGGVISSSVRTFDLLIKQRSNNTVRGPALQFDDVMFGFAGLWHVLGPGVCAPRALLRRLARCTASGLPLHCMVQGVSLRSDAASVSR